MGKGLLGSFLHGGNWQAPGPGVPAGTYPPRVGGTPTRGQGPGGSKNRGPKKIGSQAKRSLVCSWIHHADALRLKISHLMGKMGGNDMSMGMIYEESIRGLNHDNWPWINSREVNTTERLEWYMCGLSVPDNEPNNRQNTIRCASTNSPKS